MLLAGGKLLKPVILIVVTASLATAEVFNIPQKFSSECLSTATVAADLEIQQNISKNLHKRLIKNFEEDNIYDMQIQSAKYKLGNFTKVLKVFLGGPNYDAGSFWHIADELELSLLRLADVINYGTPYDRVLADELLFAQKMFYSMSDAVEYYKYCKTSLDPVYGLLWSIVDLDVRILIMRDSRGIPNPSIHQYDLKIAIFLEYLHCWKIIFHKFHGLASGLEVLFQKKLNQLEHNLDTLASYKWNSREHKN